MKKLEKLNIEQSEQLNSQMMGNIAGGTFKATAVCRPKEDQGSDTDVWDDSTGYDDCDFYMSGC